MRELPSGWASAPLDDLGVEVREGIAPSPGTTYELWSVPAFATGRPEIIEGHEIGSAKRVVRPHDVLVCKINPRINRVWLVAEPPRETKQIASPEYLIFRTTNAAVASYLRWYLSSPGFRAWIELSVEGATGSHTRAKSGPILRQVVPVPPLAEQRRIVAAIEEQFSRLDATVRSLDDAMRRLATLKVRSHSAAIECGEELQLDELLTGIEAGKSFKCKEQPAQAGDWGVIKVSAMTWGSFDATKNKTVTEMSQVDGRWEIRSGDLLLSRANTSELVGAAVLVGECRPKLLLSDKSMRLLVRPDIDKAWLRLALASREVRSQMSAVATGTSDSMRNISQQKVRQLRLRVPGLAEQRRIVAELEQQLSLIDSLRAAVESAQKRSAALRRAILERAFRGELVPQDPADEPASVLLERIRAERAAAPKPDRRRKPAV